MAALRIGSRGSQLALWQANHVAAALRAWNHEVEIEVIRTTGDKTLEVPLSRVGTKGMFTREIEEALSQGRIHLAVHSLKDLPTEVAAEFELAAVLEREDPRDVFLSPHYARLADLPQGASVGTSSLRRQAQLKALRPDLEVIPMRGNVDTRLRKLEAGECQAVVLAAAGVNRLGLTELVREILTVDTMCPAAGQGALAIEIRADDSSTRDAVSFLDHEPSRIAVACERALLNSLGGGCQVPIGAWAEVHKNFLRLTAIVARPSGSELLRESQTGEKGEELGRRVGETLLRKGAAQILRDVYGSQAAVPEQP